MPLASTAAMVLIAEAQQVRAKLELKGRWRPEKMVRKKMPDGAGMLAKVPQRSESSRGADEAAALTVDKKYCDAIDQVSAVFGRQKRSNSTAPEFLRRLWRGGTSEPDDLEGANPCPLSVTYVCN